MRNLLNPKWIFIVNTLPILVLFFIFYGEFTIIKSLLEDDSISLWKSFGLILAVLGMFNFGYGAYLSIRKQNVSAYYGIIALLCYIPFIYLFGFHSNDIIPFTIPPWMFPGHVILYVGTFLMPTLAYSLFVLVVHFTPETTDHKAWKSFLIAVITPIAWYLFSQIIFPLWKPVDSNYSNHTFLIFIIICILIALFFLVRSILILAIKKAVIWKKHQLAWKIPISILLPLIGLLLNNGHLFSGLRINEIGVFGNFDNYWFYVLTVLNGLFICLPNLENKLYRLLLFMGRSITFSYTFYFFIVFLPFLPVSVYAILAFGAGFLMLTPLLLFALHVNELSKDFNYLKLFYSKNLVWTFSIISFSIIPLFITKNYLNDKSNLHKTLEYLYSPDYSKSYNIDKNSLQKTLEIVKSHKTKINRIFAYHPYLSSYFNWLVLDNLTLSDTKINKIERIFFGKALFKPRFDKNRHKKVDITSISTSSAYDDSQNAWKSWIELELSYSSSIGGYPEYTTTFELPEGSWISDYYLYVRGKKEMGILAEKKAAMWVFLNITNKKNDPGILRYLTGNKVAFTVFPSAKDEVRKTGIELIHKEPIQFTIDGNTVSLGNPEIEQEAMFQNENVAYVSVFEKQNLKKVKRKPYFHFVIDATTADDIPDYQDRIEQIIRKHSDLTENAKVSFVNSYVTTTSFNDDWIQQFKEQNFEGGFYADRAIKSILFNSYKEQSGSYPVIVVVTDSIQNAVFDKDFSDWSFSFPEINLFYNLNENGKLKPHSLTNKPRESITDTPSFSFKHSVLKYQMDDNSVQFLPDNNKPSIILKNDTFETIEAEIKEKNWHSALTMQAKWTSQILHPENTDKEWLNLVKYSFLSKILTPVTSYLVVDNEAQKAILKKKQTQVLTSKKSLDLNLGSEFRIMSEPNLYILAILLAIMLAYQRIWQ